MSKNNNAAWATKYGPRRVRHEAPTLQEAIIAAQGMTDDVEAQADLAASLMGVPRDEVVAELAKLAPQPKPLTERKNVTVAFSSSRSGVERAVVVERKPSRRIALSSSDRAAFVRKLSTAR